MASNNYSSFELSGDVYDRRDFEGRRSRPSDDRYGYDNEQQHGHYEYDPTHQSQSERDDLDYYNRQQRAAGKPKEDSLYPDPEDLVDLVDDVHLNSHCRRTFRRGPGVDHYDRRQQERPYENYSPRSIRDMGYSCYDKQSARDLCKLAPSPLDDDVFEGRSIYEERVYEEKPYEEKDVEQKRRTPHHKKQPTMIEIEPGFHAPLRGADETYRAIKLDFYVPTECLCCGNCIFCISDAEFVLCPGCRVVSPLIGGEGANPNGVGLGFTIEDLANWQEDIMRDTSREQRRQAKEAMQHYPRNRW